MRNLHNAGVEALELGFADDVTPPGNERVEHTENAEAEYQRRRGVHVMHPADGTDCHNKGGHRADRRPWARIDQVIVVMLGVSVGHRLNLRLKFAMI